MTDTEKVKIYPRLVEMLKALSSGLSYTHGPYLADFTRAHDLLREIGELDAHPDSQR